MLREFLRRFWFEILAFLSLFILVVAGLLFALRYNRVIRRQKEDLEREIQKRKEAAVALEESERRFRDLVLTVGDWVWEVDKKGQYTFCSDTVESILGYSSKELIGRSPFEFMPEDEAKRARVIFRPLYRKRLPIRDLENWTVSKSGKKICLLTSGVPIFDAKGNFQGYRGVDKDITELKKARQRLVSVQKCLSGFGPDYRENIKRVVETAGEILEAFCAYFHELIDGRLVTIHAWKAPGDFGVNPGKRTFCYQTLSRSRGDILIVTRLQDSRYGMDEPRFTELGLNLYIGKPIHVGGEPAGVLCIFFKERVSPDQQTVNLLGVLGEALSKELERYRFSKKLKEREEFLRTLIESAIDGIAVMDLNRRIIEANQAFCEMFGFPREEIIGESIGRIHLSAEKMEEFGKTVYPVVKEKGYWRGEWDLRCKDGGIVPVETVTAVLRGVGDASPRGYVAFIRDVTERRRVEKELREAHARLMQIIDSIHSILIGLRSDGTVILWNGVAEKVLGVPEEEIVGFNLGDKTISWEWEKIETGIHDCAEQRRIINVEDVHFASPDGEKGILGMTVNPVFNTEGDLTGILILAADITKKRVMEAQLLQAQKMESIGQLAAGIAHEINTPTQFIGDNVNFLRDAFEDLGLLMEKYTKLVEQAKKDMYSADLIQEIEELFEELDTAYLMEEIPKTLEQTLEGVRRVSKIVKAMKEFSHPGVKEKVMMDLNRSIETTLTVTKNAWKYVAEVETRLDPNLPAVPCMPDEINQVFLNLIVNAAQAIESVLDRESGEKGKIVVSTRDMEDCVEIRVQDTGSGIPEEIQNRIFDPFFTTKEVGKGTGQGLAIAHDTVVNKHGGQIFFETKMGKGTTFVVRLPKDPKMMGGPMA